MADIERWITVNGNHIPIMKGENAMKAVGRFIKAKSGAANRPQKKKIIKGQKLFTDYGKRMDETAKARKARDDYSDEYGELVLNGKLSKEEFDKKYGELQSKLNRAVDREMKSYNANTLYNKNVVAASKAQKKSQQEEEAKQWAKARVVASAKDSKDGMKFKRELEANGFSVTKKSRTVEGFDREYIISQNGKRQYSVLAVFDKAGGVTYDAYVDRGGRTEAYSLQGAKGSYPTDLDGVAKAILKKKK